MFSYILISVLMVACIVLALNSSKQRAIRAKMDTLKTDEYFHELRKRHEKTIKPRRNRNGKKYRARRAAGKCKAKGK